MAQDQQQGPLKEDKKEKEKLKTAVLISQLDLFSKESDFYFGQPIKGERGRKTLYVLI